jgi:hypothetical protein
MAYSRWINSIWYTFWSAESDEVYKDNQIFEICDLDGITFTYAELRESLDDCIERVKLHYSLEKEHTVKINYYVDRFGELCYFEKTIRRKPTRISNSELSELREYMERFMKDVDNDDSLF